MSKVNGFLSKDCKMQFVKPQKRNMDHSCQVCLYNRFMRGLRGWRFDLIIMLTHVLTFLVIKLCFSEICQVLEIKIFFQLGKVDVLSILADLLSRWAPSHQEEIKNSQVNCHNRMKRSGKDYCSWSQSVGFENGCRKFVLHVKSFF